MRELTPFLCVPCAPCVGIRAVPVGEAMLASVLADHFLRHRGQIGG